MHLYTYSSSNFFVCTLESVSVASTVMINNVPQIFRVFFVIFKCVWRCETSQNICQALRTERFVSCLLLTTFIHFAGQCTEMKNRIRSQLSLFLENVFFEFHGANTHDGSSLRSASYGGNSNQQENSSHVEDVIKSLFVIEWYLTFHTEFYYNMYNL